MTDTLSTVQEKAGCLLGHYTGIADSALQERSCFEGAPCRPVESQVNTRVTSSEESRLGSTL